MHVLQFKSKIS